MTYKSTDGIISSRLLDWYACNARELPWRRDRNPYHVWISEIMLQQTRVEAVIPYYEQFIKSLPSIQALSDADENILMKLWEGLGYYSRARNLQKAAKLIVNEHGGDFPETVSEIRNLPGIGPYTAGAIASICFDLPTPAVDGNVLRVAARLFEIETSVNESKTKMIINDQLETVYRGLQPKQCGTFTQALMEIGATICIPNGKPACSICPLNDLCKAFRNGTAMNLPVRTARKEKREEKITVLISTCNEKYAIRRRPQEGLLAGMWEFANVPDWLTAPEAADWAKAHGLRPGNVDFGETRTHVFTHIRWHMQSYRIECGDMPAEFVWATLRELSEVYAIPTAFRLFLKPIPDREESENLIPAASAFLSIGAPCSLPLRKRAPLPCIPAERSLLLT